MGNLAVVQPTVNGDISDHGQLIRTKPSVIIFDENRFPIRRFRE
jgi:hypothetical protein